MERNGIISLFSGCGGFDLGFHSKGFRTVAALDADGAAVKHYARNIAPCASVVDLREESLDYFCNRNVAVMLAGPPCQGFSTAGHRDPEDARNDLLPLAGELAARVRPQVFVLENVAAAKSGEQRHHWDRLENRLRAARYKTFTLKANALAVGMAQRRQRLFFFAWRTGREINFTWPAENAARLDHVLAGVESMLNFNPKPLQPGSRLFTISQRIGPGQKLSNVRGGTRSVHTWHIPEVFGRTTAAECELLEKVMQIRRAERRRDFGDADPVSISRLKQEFGGRTGRLVSSLLQKGYLRFVGRRIDLVHTFNGKCRRFRWDDVACTVDTRFGDPNLFLHPNEHRPFTVREAARIQGFPDDFLFDGREVDQFRLIGNAVPPPMGEATAVAVRHLLRLA